MKELVPKADHMETEMLFLHASQRAIGPNSAEDEKWIQYFHMITDIPVEELPTRNFAVVNRQAINNSIKAEHISSVLKKQISVSEIERDIVRSSTSFHIRQIEEEYRLAVPSNAGAAVFDLFNHQPCNVDCYSASGIARVRFSPEFNQVRMNVKVPIAEYSDGRRKRLKYEYRGEPPMNQDFLNTAHIVACSFLESDLGEISIKQSVEVIKRDEENLPVWLNRNLKLNEEIRAAIGSPNTSVDERVALLKNLIEDPLEYTETEDEYWIEVDAGDTNELVCILNGYQSRSDSRTSDLLVQAEIMN